MPFLDPSCSWHDDEKSIRKVGERAACSAESRVISPEIVETEGEEAHFQLAALRRQGGADVGALRHEIMIVIVAAAVVVRPAVAARAVGILGAAVIQGAIHGVAVIPGGEEATPEMTTEGVAPKEAEEIEDDTAILQGASDPKAAHPVGEVKAVPPEECGEEVKVIHQETIVTTNKNQYLILENENIVLSQDQNQDHTVIIQIVKVTNLRINLRVNQILNLTDGEIDHNHISQMMMIKLIIHNNKMIKKNRNNKMTIKNMMK